MRHTFFRGFYICWEYVISFSQHFPMRKFSPSPSPPPLSGPFFQKQENWGKQIIKNGKIKISKEQKLNSISYRSHNDRNNLFPWHFNFFITAGQKIIAIFHHLHSQILLNDFDFWKFSTPSRQVRGRGKFLNHKNFALFGLWKSWTKKVLETQISNFWHFD